MFVLFLGHIQYLLPPRNVCQHQRRGGEALSATTDYNLQQTRRTAGAHILKGEDNGVYATRNQLSPSVQKGSGKHLLRLGSARKRGRGMEGTCCGDSSPPANILEVIQESQFPPARLEIQKGSTDPCPWPGVFPKLNPTPIRRPGRKIQRSTKRSRVRWASTSWCKLHKWLVPQRANLSNGNKGRCHPSEK